MAENPKKTNNDTGIKDKKSSPKGELIIYRGEQYYARSSRGRASFTTILR